eukprot:TRINITY_DN1748_c0_g3_i1.p1 TRINITY_DN1748_c0_g3~~TRINITY_DN1748_c0_g3_i1.p1  ORF type:complete len:507 (+),score=70.93 TRINITY_DN1748_c0_g3_i1:55-1521(+)
MEIFIQDPMGETHPVHVEANWKMKDILQVFTEQTGLDAISGKLEFEGSPLPEDMAVKDTALVGGSLLEIMLGMSRQRAAEIMKRFPNQNAWLTHLVNNTEPSLMEALVVSGQYKKVYWKDCFIFKLIQNEQYRVAGMILKELDIQQSAAVTLGYITGIQSYTGDLMRFCVEIDRPIGVQMLLEKGYNRLMKKRMDLVAITLGRLQILKIFDKHCPQLTNQTAKWFGRVVASLRKIRTDPSMVQYCIETTSLPSKDFSVTKGMLNNIEDAVSAKTFLDILLNYPDWSADPIFYEYLDEEDLLTLFKKLRVHSKKGLKSVACQYLAAGKERVAAYLLGNLDDGDFDAELFVKMIRAIIAQKKATTDMTFVTNMFKPKLEDVRCYIETCGGDHPCFAAVIANRYDLVNWMIETQYVSTDANYKIRDGTSLVSASCRHTDTSILQYLIRHGAAVNTKTVQGHSPLDKAIAHKNEYARDILLKAGAKLGKEIR